MLRLVINILAFLEDDYNNNMIIYLRCAKTLTWVFSPFKVDVGTCGIGRTTHEAVQTTGQTRLQEMINNIIGFTLSRCHDLNQRATVYTTVKTL